MSRVPTTSAVGEEETSTSKEDLSLEQKIGMAKKFDREMKDYAKATVKEFLGIYGYEEDVDINMEESDTQKGETSSTQNATGTDRPIESEPSTSTASTMTSMCKVEKGTGVDRPVSSVSISSSTTNGNADMTRFCITMSIPRPGADSLESYTTLRFWNCIMCSTAFVGTKPEIIQRVHHPQLFTYQPEWLSHAGICNRCQKTLTMQTPKITIYAISETPSHHHGYNGSTSPIPGTSFPGASISGTSIPRASIPGTSMPGASMPGSSVPQMHVPGTFVPGAYMPRASLPVVMCNALPGQCNCAHGGHNHVPGASHLAYPVVNVPVVDEAKQACAETGYKTPVTQYTPITCTQ